MRGWDARPAHRAHGSVHVDVLRGGPRPGLAARNASRKIFSFAGSGSLSLPRKKVKTLGWSRSAQATAAAWFAARLRERGARAYAAVPTLSYTATVQALGLLADHAWGAPALLLREAAHLPAAARGGAPIALRHMPGDTKLRQARRETARRTGRGRHPGPGAGLGPLYDLHAGDRGRTHVPLLPVHHPGRTRIAQEDE